MDQPLHEDVTVFIKPQDNMKILMKRNLSYSQEKHDEEFKLSYCITKLKALNLAYPSFSYSLLTRK